MNVGHSNYLYCVLLYSKSLDMIYSNVLFCRFLIEVKYLKNYHFRTI